jgi:hypothetical protein
VEVVELVDITKMGKNKVEAVMVVVSIGSLVGVIFRLGRADQ